MSAAKQGITKTLSGSNASFNDKVASVKLKILHILTFSAGKTDGASALELDRSKRCVFSAIFRDLD